MQSNSIGEQPRGHSNRHETKYGEIHVIDHGTAHLGDIITNNYFQPGRSDEQRELFVKSLYYGSMNARKDQIRDAENATCDWIWSTKFALWLASSDERIFWISGKPGSGKSTLVKFLAKASKVKDHSLQSTEPPIAVDFYFDFRQGQRTGNTEEGLLRSLLRQVAVHVRGMGKILKERNFDGSQLSMDEMLQFLHMALSTTSQHFLAFVDGLDEYEGDMKLLLDRLKSLERHDRLKLCLASRPEPMIRAMLESVPRISMSDHNTTGIREYVQSMVTEFQPHLTHVQLPEIQEIILARAEGVFLWVHLALASIITACINGATADEIKQKLNSLPTEVEELYERIVDRIPPDRKSEAAILYTFASTSEPEPYISTELLQQASDFLAFEVGSNALPPQIHDVEHFQRRFHATMGGLLELVPTVFETGLRSKRKKQCMSVRLMHETVRSFSIKSGWVAKYLPYEFQLALPNYVWARLCFKFLLALDNKAEAVTSKISNARSETIGLPDNHNIPCQGDDVRTQQVETVALTIFDSPTRTTLSSNVDQQCFPNERLRRWPWLLCHSINQLFNYVQCYGAVNDKQFQLEMQAALQSEFAQIHLRLVNNQSDNRVPSKEALATYIRDLNLAASHSCFQYLEMRIVRIKALSDRDRNDIVVAMLRAVISPNCQCVQRVAWTQLRSSVNSILAENRQIDSFHLSIYVRLGYKEMPQFLLKQLMKGTEQLWHMLYDPARPQIQDRPPLFVWACNYAETGESERDGKPESQLQVLLALGVDINGRDSEGYNIVHYLITKHIVNHTYLEPENTVQCYPHDDLVEALEKLYLVHRAGANFKVQFEHRTPLQALRYGLDRIHERPPEELYYEQIQEGRFAHLEYVLEHEEQTGHLPTPLMGQKWRAKPKEALQHRCDLCESTTNTDNMEPDTINEPRKLVPSRKAPKPPAPSSESVLSSSSHVQQKTPRPPRGRHLSRSPRPLPASNPLTLGDAETAFTISLNPSKTSRTSRSLQPSASPRYAEPTTSSRQGPNALTRDNVDTKTNTSLSPSSTPRPSRSLQPSAFPQHLEPVTSSRRASSTLTQGETDTPATATLGPSRTLQASGSSQPPPTTPRYLEPTASSKQRQLATQQEVQSREKSRSPRSR